MNLNMHADITGDMASKQLPVNYRIPIKLLDVGSPMKLVTATVPEPSSTMNYYTEPKTPTRSMVSPLASPSSKVLVAVSPSSRKRAITNTLSPTSSPAAAASSPSGTTSASSAASVAAASGGASLPAELTKLFLPMLCQLCKVQSNSSISARVHYESKVHSKKITAWLMDWTQRTGEPMPKRVAVLDGPCGPNALHCSLCDLSLTSLLHAKQHYMGKKHKAVLNGRKQPAGSGYYDDNGTWVRTILNPASDPSGRFNIGVSFVSGTDATPVNNSSSSSGDGTAAPTTVVASQYNGDEPMPAAPNTDVFCAVCQITVSAKSEMAKHLEGGRHARKLKAAGAPPHAPDGAAVDTIARSLRAPKSAGSTIGDHSVNRTPSGQFYCKPCNLTVSDEHTFEQHLGSKKHAKVVRGN